MAFKIGAAIVAVACAAIISASSAQTAAPEKTDISIAVGGKTFMIYLPLSVTGSRSAGFSVRVTLYGRAHKKTADRAINCASA
ncbi:hypothetical protein [Bradyrhizobium sp.]|uniref:hypothetical protein n=1 Tax=Bradyrhizobium sp. TaxID=376 RepID=UPI0025C73AA0|nr:hypothetical protein [Bradyrhizobium sp.]